MVGDSLIRWAYYHPKKIQESFKTAGALEIGPDKTVATIASDHPGGFFHWITDVLPRLEILKRSGEKFDALYVPATPHPWQKASLEKALKQVGFEKIPRIDAGEHPKIKAAKLVMPSYPALSYHYPKWSIDFLRETFMPKNGTVPPSTRRIYISRGDAPTRKLSNEDELIPRLRARGFEIVTLNGMTLEDQAKLFRDASIIMGPHGASSTNLVFGTPGAQLFELFTPEWTHGSYVTLAEKMGMKHNQFIGKANATGNQNYDVDIAAVLREADEDQSLPKSKLCSPDRPNKSIN